MDERDKRRVGELVEPGDRRKAPGRLELLQRFLNTWNHEFPPEWDRLGSPERAAGWLGRKRLVPQGTVVTGAEAARLRELREAMRVLAVANRDGVRPPTAASAAIRRASRAARLIVETDPTGRTRLEPSTAGVPGAVAALLAILHEAQLRGDWRRMKACRQCEYVFFDRSKNRSAAWCAMSICGNRTKNRAYRRRQAVTRSTRRSS